ncbi:hypothetical protein KIV56_05495 [Cryobacterium breve]|uniref:Secreted protein n=1 Tax=Cryobacterium breve TaxID=1259258 RepID=A0ABY7NGU6_9MICO|nr:hypothetical protein [Cryobacterium breve]WBM80795.1 hypothetical protein KIV56_05495 [Cryobacterium breve]
MSIASPTRTVAVSATAIGACFCPSAGISTTVTVPSASASPLLIRYPKLSPPSGSGRVSVTLRIRWSRISIRMPLDAGTFIVPVISSTPFAGSKSVASTSTRVACCPRMKAVCGTVTGLLLALAAGATSTRTLPVAVSCPSVTEYSISWTPGVLLRKRNAPEAKSGVIVTSGLAGTLDSRSGADPPRA